MATSGVGDGRPSGTLLKSFDVPCEAASVSDARRTVRHVLGDDHPRLDEVLLLLSELVTNSLVHSRSRYHGQVTVTLVDLGPGLRVEVLDAGGETAPRVAGGDSADHGRGLMLVDAYASSWGYHDTPDGRTVWFEMD